MSIKFYDSNGKYWGEYDETRSLFIPSEEVLADRKTEPQKDCKDCKYIWWSSVRKSYECSLPKCPYTERSSDEDR